MKKLCTIAIVSLAAVGLCAERASAFYLLKNLCCCGHGYKVTCRPYNAFSPPCCYPCFGMAPFAYPGCNGCGQSSCGPNGGGAPVMDYAVPPSGGPAVPGQMPPATAAPQYMPPAPAEADGGQARMMPQMPMWGGMPAQNVMYQPMAMGYYPPMAPMMQQPMMAPQMMQGQMMPPQMMQPQMLPQQVIQQGYYGR